VINDELSDALPIVFPGSLMKRLTTSEFTDRLDNWLHKFFVEKFGLAPAPVNRKHRRRTKVHKKLLEFRRRKTKLRAARRAVMSLGSADGVLSKLLTQQWRMVMKAHARFRLALNKKTLAAKQSKAETAFKLNPNVFASRLFNNSDNLEPTFSKADAQAFFTKTYSDSDRDLRYAPLRGMKRPPPPVHIFMSQPPTMKEITKTTRAKRNGAAASFNGLTYVPYKKCPAILFLLHKFFARIWKNRDIPAPWAAAFMSLLSKSDITDICTEFRNIAVASTCGKLFFSVVKDRMQTFMVKNNFIRSVVQKGFMDGIPGSIEHSFTLFETLRNASGSQKQICCAWIDLANAFGSVRHNLIQFALHWYHIPDFIQELIWNYYDKLVAMIRTKEWSTDFFSFEIGCFQGCVLSTILFNCVFQLLLDFLAPLHEEGYNFSNIDLVTFLKAFADDLTIITSTPAGNQRVLDSLSAWLEWTRCMAAKPKKCVSVAYRQFDRRSTSHRFTPLNFTKYSAFDPMLTLNGITMGSLANPGSGPSKLLKRVFKFLGLRIHVSLSDEPLYEDVRELFVKDLSTVNSSHVNGLMKLWLYQFYILARLAWPLSVQNFSMSFAKDLESHATSFLKKWACLHRSADVGTLYRPKSAGGLGITSVSHHFAHMQTVKSHLLKYSPDASVSALYAARERSESKFTRNWSASNLLSSLESDVDFDLKFPSQSDRRGLGHGRFVQPNTSSAKRKLVLTSLRDLNAKRHKLHAHGLTYQGRWTTWSDCTRPFDLSWKNLIYGPGPNFIKFVLNATINSLVTPRLSHMWGHTSSAGCRLCTAPIGTLHHILSSCPIALASHRYTWRHDSVLKHLTGVLTTHLAKHNETSKALSVPHLKKSFVGDFSDYKTPTRACKSISTSPLTDSNDWKITADFTNNNSVFPPSIFSTSSRPDIVIYSSKSHTVLLLELTCPAEEGVDAARLRKVARYTKLCDRINNGTIWSAHLYTLEVGARGYVAHSVASCLRSLGLSPKDTRKACLDLSQIVARCSYDAIYLAHKSNIWLKPDLLQLQHS
jgi:hypothetical protein